MSRFHEDGDDPEYPNAGELWWANCERSVTGRRGQRVLADLEAALLAMPKKALVSGAVATADGCACTVGALVAHKHAREGYLSFVEAMQALANRHSRCDCGHGTAKHALGFGPCFATRSFGWNPIKYVPCSCRGFDIDDSGFDAHDTAWLAKEEAGLTFALAWRLVYLNDEELSLCTDEERYAGVLAWVRKHRATA